jgi:hypothetical protein
MGIELSELIDMLAQNHEAEFMWNDMEYMIQPVDDHIILYRSSPDLCDLCKITLSGSNLVGEDIVRKLLNEKCFNGKSFMELQNEITITVIR